MRRLLPVLIPALLVLPATALAVHWPNMGGDTGRSGNQPVDPGTTPLTAVWSKTAATDQGVISSPLVTGGSPDEQLVVYGTPNGSIHLRRLNTGAAVGPEAGIQVDNSMPIDPDILGRPGTAFSVTPASTSTDAGPGQLWVVYNDDDGSAVAPGLGNTAGSDLTIAQIDEATGDVIQRKKVEDADGFSITSSVVLGPADGSGNRSLFFVAARADTSGRLYSVPLVNASSRGATIGTARYTGSYAMPPEASPAIVALRSPSGVPTYYVAIATADRVRTFTAGELDAGPESPGFAGGTPETPAVPTQASGAPAGPGQPVTVTPSIYTAVTSSDGLSTTVYQFQQSGNALTTKATSPARPGTASPGMAVSQVLTPAGASGGNVVLTTTRNLTVLNADGLGFSGALSPDDSLTSGTSGFSAATPAVSGNLAYVKRDDGRQLIVGLPSAQPISPASFPGQDASVGGGLRSGVGQVAISRGYVVFGGPQGVSVYRNTDQTPPLVAVSEPAAGASVSGTVTVSAVASDTRGIAKVELKAGGRSLGTDTTAAGGSPFFPEGGTYSVSVPASELGSGTVSLTAVATDTSGLSTTSAARSVTTGGSTAPPSRQAIVFGAARFRSLASLRQNGISARVRCFSARCTVRTTLKTGLTRVGLTSVTVNRGVTRVRTRLSAAGRAYVRRKPPTAGRALRLRLTVKLADGRESKQRTGGFIVRP